MTTNPVRVRRLQNHLTQKALSQLLGVTPQTVLMLEQGLFNSIPQEIAQALSVSNHTYHAWVRNQRHENELAFHNAITDQGWLNFRLSVHPTFRGFCRQLVFQPSILREYENYKQRNRQILSEALVQVHLSDQALQNLRLLSRRDLGLDYERTYHEASQRN